MFVSTPKGAAQAKPAAPSSTTPFIPWPLEEAEG
jgi:hypothetical protein